MKTLLRGEWEICGLSDGEILGPGYNYVIRTAELTAWDCTIRCAATLASTPAPAAWSASASSSSGGWSYSYTKGLWGSCSVSCGTGTQTRPVACQDSSGNSVGVTFCASDGLAAPSAQQTCTMPYCPALYSCSYAMTGGCSAPCGTSATGIRLWIGTCKSAQGQNVPQSYCGSCYAGPAQTDAAVPCIAEPVCPGTTPTSAPPTIAYMCLQLPLTGNPCSVTCGQGVQQVTSRCVNAQGQTVDSSLCDASQCTASLVCNMPACTYTPSPTALPTLSPTLSVPTPPRPKVYSCVFGASVCSVTCGPGVMLLANKCIEGANGQGPTVDTALCGSSCTSSQVMQGARCNLRDCPVSGTVFRCQAAVRTYTTQSSVDVSYQPQPPSYQPQPPISGVSVQMQVGPSQVIPGQPIVQPGPSQVIPGQPIVRGSTPQVIPQAAILIAVPPAWIQLPPVTQTVTRTPTLALDFSRVVITPVPIVQQAVSTATGANFDFNGIGAPVATLAPVAQVVAIPGAKSYQPQPPSLQPASPITIAAVPITVAGQPITIAGQPITIAGQPITIAGQPVYVPNGVQAQAVAPVAILQPAIAVPVPRETTVAVRVCSTTCGPGMAVGDTCIDLSTNQTVDNVFCGDSCQSATPCNLMPCATAKWIPGMSWHR